MVFPHLQWIRFSTIATKRKMLPKTTYNTPRKDERVPSHDVLLITKNFRTLNFARDSFCSIKS